MERNYLFVEKRRPNRGNLETQRDKFYSLMPSFKTVFPQGFLDRDYTLINNITLNSPFEKINFMPVFQQETYAHGSQHLILSTFNLGFGGGLVQNDEAFDWMFKYPTASLQRKNLLFHILASSNSSKNYKNSSFFDTLEDSLRSYTGPMKLIEQFKPVHLKQANDFSLKEFAELYVPEQPKAL